jgi:hypothetical protein
MLVQGSSPSVLMNTVNSRAGRTLFGDGVLEPQISWFSSQCCKAIGYHGSVVVIITNLHGPSTLLVTS